MYRQCTTSGILARDLATTAMQGPGSIPIYVVSGFFDFGGFISAGFLGLKYPKMHLDLGILVHYIRNVDTTL